MKAQKQETKIAMSTTNNTTTMKAMQVHDFVSDYTNLDKIMTMSNDIEIPKPKKDQILLKVLACSISPGDLIMVQGNLKFLHPDKFPFVPGMDVCGVVVDTNGHDTKFQKGDTVVASNGIAAIGGMAEYMAVDVIEVVHKPTNVSPEVAASSSSAITARNAVLDNVNEGDRVLILGGSGGVGSAAITLAKHHAKASFVATTSSQTQLCTSLGADMVINYKTDNWWEMDWKGQPFDKIIDTVGGGNYTNRATKQGILKTGKQGGAFIAVCGDEPKPDANTWWKAIKFMSKMPLRPMYTWFMKHRVPSYVMIMPYNIPQGRKQVLDMINDGGLTIPLDSKTSSLRFTENDVRKAFAIVASHHAHGKVVVSMK